jgi:hypothetical protein
MLHSLNRKASRWPARVMLALASTLTFAGLGTAAYATSNHPAATSGQVASVTLNATTAHSGWQGDATFNVPPGITGLFVHYTCSTGKAISGSFRLPSQDPSENTINLVNNSPIKATVPTYSQWGWSFTWSGSTAPSGSQIIFDVYCS